MPCGVDFRLKARLALRYTLLARQRIEPKSSNLDSSNRSFEELALREVDKQVTYLQQQLRYEKALEREQIERKAREEENLLIREEQERLRRLFERERAERERLEQIRRREAEERERLLRQHRLDEQDRLRRIEEEKRLRQLQVGIRHGSSCHSRNAQQYVPSSTQEVLYDQQTFVQQHPPQPAPR
ncbi:hypothetical protein OSTOST_22434, partial [Ostertagia ostertagi]